MSSNLSDLAQQVSLTPLQALGIPVALIGAVFLSIGAQLQPRGVAKVERATGHKSDGLNVSQLFRLIGRPSWVIGTLLCTLAVVFQLTALYLAPLTVVQPLGAVALVVTAYVNSRATRQKLDRATKRAVAFCVGGVALFVTVASFTTHEVKTSNTQLIAVLVILAIVFGILLAAFLAFRSRMRAIFYVVGAGICYGFVSTIAKVIINRFQAHDLSWLLVICVLFLAGVGLLGGYFVQNAYSSGPPDLVIAGLTVVDPIVAVGMGILVLGEASSAPLWAPILFVIAGVIAIYGVFQLAKYHPQTRA
ncbi:MAG: multidrug transporter permease [Frondihabitans sp.]|nr:multidrug transporter permease [Frondihabitans sp.]